MTRSKKGGGRGIKATMATKADKYVLYEKAVQEPEAEVDFVDMAFRDLKRRKAVSLREDFCGTALTAIHWVKSGSKRRALAVDLDSLVLGQAQERVQSLLEDGQAGRIKLLRKNVFSLKADPVDVVLALNFSYFIFKERPLLQRYFRSVLKGLTNKGLFVMDCYGGSDSFLEETEEREVDSFVYQWETEKYNPITGDVVNHIHFRFPDGSRMEKAFTYDWRLWTLPELQEILTEAGFSSVHVYWEGTDDDESGDGVFTRTREGEACQGWVAYIVACP